MMKNYFLVALITILSSKAFADGPPPESFTLTPSVTLLAASSTNSTRGTIKQLSGGESVVRIWASCSGIPATTNGVSSVSNIVFKIVTASGSSGITNLFDSPTHSTITITVPAPGSTTTNIASTRIDLTGARYIAIGQIENNTLGIVSNFVVNAGYPPRNN